MRRRLSVPLLLGLAGAAFAGPAIEPDTLRAPMHDLTSPAFGGRASARAT